MRRWWPLLILAFLAAPSPAEDQTLSDFKRFQSYPYLDRGYRKAQQGDWPAVESLMRHLLKNVPANQDARQLLIQSLIRQEQFAAAQEEIERLDGVGSNELRQQYRLDWIAADPTIGTRVEEWLGDVEGARRAALWTAYSQRLAEREGKAAALDWLLGISPEGDDAALRRRRAVLAEALGRWGVVARQLAPLRDDRQLSAQDWQRLALAQVQRDDSAALDELLREPPSPGAARDVLEAASQRAIALDAPERAKQRLLQMEAIAPLDEDQQQQLLELARRTDDLERVVALSERQGVSCLAVVEWLSTREAGLARERLAHCAVEEDPRAWLVLAQRLEATELIAATAMPDDWQKARRELLVTLWQRQGHPRRALEWLARQPQSAQVLRQRARLLQAMNERPAAAKAWTTLYERTNDLAALDQASYLLGETGQDERARQLLETAFDRRQGRLPPDLAHRLAGLYSRSDTPLSPARIERLLPRLAGDARNQLLLHQAYAGDCEIVKDQAEEGPETAALWHAQGVCAMPDRPGQAAYFYRRALDRGDTGSRKPLAYALQAAGDPEAAYRLWQTVPADTMDEADRLAAIRSALATGHLEAATRRWQAAPARTAETWQLGADIALARNETSLALQRQRRALDLDPSAARYYRAARTARTAGETALARDWIARAAREAPDDPRYRLDYAYTLAASESPEARRRAIPLLERSTEAYPEDYRLAETLAQRYVEVGDNEAAKRQLRRAIDLEREPLASADETPDALLERRYRQRRQHEFLSRRDSVTLSSVWSPATPDAAIRGTSDGQNTQAIEWEHALGEQPINNGRQLAVYGRAFLNSDDDSRYGQSLAGGIGLRAKPFSRLNLNLYGEVYAESLGYEGATLGELLTPWHIPTNGDDGDEEDVDFLLRASASFFDQDEYRNDWRPTKSSWNERSLYLGAAWWTRDGEHQALARYRQGRAFKLPLEGAQTLMPYAMLQATSLETDDFREDVRAGLGLRWQYWFDADRYNAYRKRVTLRFEYQQALGGSLYDKNDGWLAGIEVNL
ncbi:adsorption protein A [Modicisalibacter ilicicola DSM 19980]|uniref:Adsorption protein A n=1 Tax=Modicisalibacter ilicicola DSM 19980 TaxID=1121942 RepID=A0A1M5DV76_9GAMM|nr:hypothetical protein [Halomonas ilicicola]SHF70826.1 adsorption protein A [Halomonas ilicicola DSM 19980]